MNQQKIQVTVIMESFDAEAWAFYIIEEIQKSCFAEITRVILTGKQEGKYSFSSYLYRLFIKNTGRLFKVQPNAFYVRNVGAFLKDAKISEDITGENTTDVYLNLGKNYFDCYKLQGRYGCWSLRNYNSNKDDQSLTGVWEVLLKNPVTEVILVNGDSILSKSVMATLPALHKNLNAVFWKYALLILRKLEEAQKFENKFLVENKKFLPDTGTNKNLPGNSAIISFFLQTFLKKAGNKLKKNKSKEQWVLYYKYCSEDFIIHSESLFKTLQPSQGRFWADPFVWYYKNNHYIFFEEYIYGSKKAHISVLQIQKGNKISEPQIVLQKEYHLSYPFIFDYAGEIYMMPETSAAKTIELYKAVSFPGEWVFVKNMMQGLHAVDATMLYHENKYWLFVNIKPHPGVSAWDELNIFFADSPLKDEWKAHAKNPVITDVHTARPAGNFFTENGKLYRPSQDCSVAYGYAININEVIVLSETEYEERLVKKIEPTWKKEAKATHTFSYCKGLLVLDVKEEKYR